MPRGNRYRLLNLVRAGMVNHPRHWADTGYHEIQQPPVRYRIIYRAHSRAQMIR